MSIAGNSPDLRLAQVSTNSLTLSSTVLITINDENPKKPLCASHYFPPFNLKNRVYCANYEYILCESFC
jgi:hypothetical protein